MNFKTASLALFVLGGTIPLVVCTSPNFRAGQGRPDYRRIFRKRDVMISMRDGVRLHTEIYIPKRASEHLPFLFTRTPYGTNDDAQGFAGGLGNYNELMKDGYIFVFQDLRGRYKSEGQFEMNRNPRDKNDPKATDESSDTYDTVEWLLKNIPNHNGRVGVAGISYLGWTTMMAEIDPHPAVKAVDEGAAMTDTWMGDDFFHNGAFRQSYGFEYVSEMETTHQRYYFLFNKYDTFDWYLNELQLPADANDKYFHGKLPTWNHFVEHPNYDEFWQKKALTTYLTRVNTPTLNVAGWWDQEDFYGPVAVYETLEKYDSNHMNYLVAGPWNHGGWSSDSTGRKLGAIDFSSDTSKYFREKVERPWFAYWLKNKGTRNFPEALTFQTGTNKWETHDAWPPERKVAERKLYLRSSGRLSFDPPQDGEPAFDSYVSDPAHPVPYRHRPIENTYPKEGRAGWGAWLVEDQRFVYLRPDVLAWETEVLQRDISVAGDIVAHLIASTSGTDSDWVVKLIDVNPEGLPRESSMSGYQLMIADEIFRGRFRRSFEKPEALVPNQPAEFTIDLHTNDHCFLKGHRIMVQVQSTWFPLYDRNPQKFVPNIFKATPADYQIATQRVYHSNELSSYIELPVVAP